MFQISKIPSSASVEFLEFELSSFEIANTRHSKIYKFHIFQITSFQNSKISKLHGSRIEYAKISNARRKSRGKFLIAID